MTLIPNKTIDSCCNDTCNDDCGCDDITKYDVGLGNVDNTSDADKPISTATQSALNGKADVNTVNNLLNRINTLEGYDFGDIRNRVIVLEGQVTTIQSAVITIQNDLQTVQTAIANNNTAVSNLTTLVQTYDSRITALENSISAIQGNITTLQGNYTNLEARVVNIEGNYVTTDTFQNINASKYFYNMIRFYSDIYAEGQITLMSDGLNSRGIYLQANGRGYSYLKARNGSRILSLTFDDTDIRIPTATVNSFTSAATNIAYVSDTSGTVNNLLHTAGAEEFSGAKTGRVANYASAFVTKVTAIDLTNPPTSERLGLIKFVDVNNNTFANIRCGYSSEGVVSLGLQLRNNDGTWKYINLGKADN